ncbi:MAG: hypothetical protein R3F34_10895 [Planctomycetota bacterium]
MSDLSGVFPLALVGARSPLAFFEARFPRAFFEARSPPAFFFVARFLPRGAAGISASLPAAFQPAGGSVAASS